MIMMRSLRLAVCQYPATTTVVAAVTVNAKTVVIPPVIFLIISCHVQRLYNLRWLLLMVATPVIRMNRPLAVRQADFGSNSHYGHTTVPDTLPSISDRSTRTVDEE